jgi:hypothetical protein
MGFIPAQSTTSRVIPYPLINAVFSHLVYPRPIYDIPRDITVEGAGCVLTKRPHKESGANLTHRTPDHAYSANPKQSEGSGRRTGHSQRIVPRTGHSQKIVPGLEAFNHVGSIKPGPERSEGPACNHVRNVKPGT